MFTAVPFKSHVFRPAAVVGSEAAPDAPTRLSAVSIDRSSAPTSAWPFLFDQKPSVNPPPPPRQTLPKSTVLWKASSRWTETLAGVVAIQLFSIGANSLTV